MRFYWKQSLETLAILSLKNMPLKNRLKLSNTHLAVSSWLLTRMKTRSRFTIATLSLFLSAPTTLPSGLPFIGQVTVNIFKPLMAPKKSCSLAHILDNKSLEVRPHFMMNSEIPGLQESNSLLKGFIPAKLMDLMLMKLKEITLEVL